MLSTDQSMIASVFPLADYGALITSCERLFFSRGHSLGREGASNSSASLCGV
eukprot:m.50925 g.50925  ORF g.50925 m.50925 type:complete len:52 (+) comp34105_c0_seq2:363-518(+)